MLVIGIYALVPVNPDNTASAPHILIESWKIPAFDYSHGWLIAPICLWLLIISCRKIDMTRIRASLNGLWVILLGCLLFIISFHSYQWRITNGTLPVMLIGGIWYFWGSHCALRCAFPLCFFWLCIPVPGLQQATAGMQLLATQAAHWTIESFGIDATREGTSITLTSRADAAFSIAGGCSGMRSLMALVMISFAWGFAADKLQIWKRVFLALSSIPLAIIANTFRITSIFLCAEYIDPTFASKTWHDWSGLLFFFPASVLGLTLLHGLLASEFSLLKRRSIITYKNNPKEER